MAMDRINSNNDSTQDTGTVTEQQPEPVQENNNLEEHISLMQEPTLSTSSEENISEQPEIADSQLREDPIPEYNENNASSLYASFETGAVEERPEVTETISAMMPAKLEAEKADYPEKTGLDKTMIHASHRKHRQVQVTSLFPHWATEGTHRKHRQVQVTSLFPYLDHWHNPFSKPLKRITWTTGTDYELIVKSKHDLTAPHKPKHFRAQVSSISGMDSLDRFFSTKTVNQAQFLL
ncbi:MAG: hypothetical protein HQM12_22630 [SAR324 cluster bacterium]|nr:hypothetical protein [SAR324 cluster bacterium]